MTSTYFQQKAKIARLAAKWQDKLCNISELAPTHNILYQYFCHHMIKNILLGNLLKLCTLHCFRHKKQNWYITLYFWMKKRVKCVYIHLRRRPTELSTIQVKIKLYEWNLFFNFYRDIQTSLYKNWSFFLLPQKMHMILMHYWIVFMSIKTCAKSIIS